MKKDKAHFVAFLGVMSALVFVLFLLEGGMTLAFGVSTVILSLPFAIALSMFDDWKMSFLGGTILGVCSCIFCLIYGEIIAANPLIAILPRIFIGIVAYWSCVGFTKLFRKCKKAFVRETLPIALGAMLGTITNTVLYLLALNLFAGGNILGALTQILQVAVGIYFPIELIAAAVLAPVYVKVMRKMSHRGDGAKSAELEENKSELAESNSENC